MSWREQVFFNEMMIHSVLKHGWVLMVLTRKTNNQEADKSLFLLRNSEMRQQLLSFGICFKRPSNPSSAMLETITPLRRFNAVTNVIRIKK